MSSKTFPNLQTEQALFASGARFVIGVDEVGRGAIAGPVAVGVALIDREKHTDGWPAKLRDSKLISEKVREAIKPEVEAWVSDSAVGMASAKEIDEQGITRALALSAGRALNELLADASLRQQLVHDGAVILLDGSHNWMGDQAGGIRVVVQTKADRDCVSVAAASVIAKVTRDRLMVELADEVSGYGLDGHKGYASAAHIAAVRALGPSSQHRVTWLSRILAVESDSDSTPVAEV